MSKTRRVNKSQTKVTDGHESALIAHLQGEIAYLRAELAKRAEELARERERGDVLHREALARIDALASGTVADRPPDDVPVAEPMETADTDSVQVDGAAEPVAHGSIHREWDELTELFIAELGMEPQAAWTAAAQELGIANGRRVLSNNRPNP